MNSKNKGNISKNTNTNKNQNNKINKKINNKISNNIDDESDNNKLNIIEYNNDNNSELKTKKKEFINKVDPHNLKRLIQKERCIWFGVHNELLRNKNMIKLIEKCKDKSLPIESAAIHLDKYRVGFNKNRVFIDSDENSVIFFKLYLITKEQFLDILKIQYLCNDSIDSEIKKIFNMKKINEDINLCKYQTKGNCFYDILKCVGELDGINIFALTSKNCDIEPPDNEYLRIIYNGLLKTFHPYSEYLIMYYLYLLDGIKNFFSMKQLEEIFLQNKVNHRGTEHVSSISSETNLTIGEVQNQNKLLGMPTTNNKFININKNNIINNTTPNNSNKQNIINVNNIKNEENKNLNTSKDSIEAINETPKQNIQKNETDTVKCSTCNGSPFISTAEKNQLNQYSYIFDLHHLPIFDETTGEFFWNNNDVNWKLAHDSILKSDEASKSVNLLHGSLVSLSNDFSTLNANSLGEGNNSPKKEDDKNNSGTFIEELNNILKEIN